MSLYSRQSSAFSLIDMSSTHTTPAYTDKTLTPRLIILPDDVIVQIRSILILNAQKATAGKLMRCSKAFYGLFLPVLNYPTLGLRAGTKSHGVFEGLMKVDLSDHRLDENSTIPTHTFFSKYPFPTPSTHARKLSLLQQCTQLTIHDLSSAKIIVDYQSAIGKDESQTIFPNVRKLNLGSDLIFALISGIYNQEWFQNIQDLAQSISPREICLTLPSPTMQDNMSKIPKVLLTPQDSHDIYPHFDNVVPDFGCGSSNRSNVRTIDETTLNAIMSDIWINEQQMRSLNSLLKSFKPSVATFHNVTIQSLPLISSVKKYSVYFADLGCSFRCKDKEVNFWSEVLLERVSLKRANRIMECIDRTAIEEGAEYNFIDAELHDCEVCEAARNLEMDRDSDEDNEEGNYWAFDEEKNEQSEGKVEKIVRGLISMANQDKEIADKLNKAISFCRRADLETCKCCDSKY
ncbi:uncharacterized protein I206_104664 [Kwoniella pini CBS 10737]|uniref:Uncharacterized protein n=1 Tax=Kwoniella pini CBS 10737 TaxID=1296096 RepID=A0A1B9I7J4_9TREE|nr:uncharacterized protein I206_02202 [Kwoniella pini CBS 10737]OCF51488.1 hypothetical protein I206_02202 [Kwoniella pini CBS 10737]